MLYLSGGLLEGLDQHLAVRRCLQALYRTVYGAFMPPLEKSPSGQPLFSVPGCYCSLTHTRKAAFCALSDKPVGLDAEAEDRALSPGVAEKILAPEELAQYLASGEDAACPLSFWVLKEAYVKFTGQGLNGRPRAFAFDLSGARPHLIGAAEPEPHFTLLRRNGHILAVCALAEDAPIFL